MDLKDSEGNKPVFTGIWIPAEVLGNGIDAREGALYGMVAAFGSRGCYMLAEDIEKQLGISSDLRRKYIKDLVERGFVIARKQNNGRIILRSTLGFRKDLQEEDEPKAEEPAKPRNPKDYGDEDVNELLGAWKDETGIDAFDNKLERKCARIILNKYGMEQALQLAKRVGAIQGVKYAPSITSLNELCGRYSKLAKLEMFERRQAIDADAKPLRKPSRLAQLHYTAPDFRWSEYEDNNNESPEQKAEAVKKAREIFAARSATSAQVARKAKR